MGIAWVLLLFVVVVVCFWGYEPPLFSHACRIINCMGSLKVLRCKVTTSTYTMHKNCNSFSTLVWKRGCFRPLRKIIRQGDDVLVTP